MAGLAGASKASIDARMATQPPPRSTAADHAVATGRDVVGAVDDAAVDRRAAGPARALPRCGGVRRGGAGHPAGHRILGADDAALNELSSRLRMELGDDAYEAARREGAVLDGDAAVEHALRAL